MEVPESLVISGDRAKLQRVFANLLDNALKYTAPTGSVKVWISGNSAFAEVAIEDTGSGIAEDELPHVFDRFFRGEKSRSAPGNGLGLSLAQAFVLLHNGEITARSRIGHGSRFIVRLPRPQSCR
jgi:signal transduction histidine kinase